MKVAKLTPTPAPAPPPTPTIVRALDDLLRAGTLLQRARDAAPGAALRDAISRVIAGAARTLTAIPILRPVPGDVGRIPKGAEDLVRDAAYGGLGFGSLLGATTATAARALVTEAPAASRAVAGKAESWALSRLARVAATTRAAALKLAASPTAGPAKKILLAAGAAVAALAALRTGSELILGMSPITVFLIVIGGLWLIRRRRN